MNLMENKGFAENVQKWLFLAYFVSQKALFVFKVEPIKSIKNVKHVFKSMKKIYIPFRPTILSHSATIMHHALNGFKSHWFCLPMGQKINLS